MQAISRINTANNDIGHITGRFNFAHQLRVQVDIAKLLQIRLHLVVLLADALHVGFYHFRKTRLQGSGIGIFGQQQIGVQRKGAPVFEEGCTKIVGQINEGADHFETEM